VSIWAWTHVIGVKPVVMVYFTNSINQTTTWWVYGYSFSFGHCVICSSIYGFWLPLCYLQTLLLANVWFIWSNTYCWLSELSASWSVISKHKSKDRVARTPLRTGGELRWSGKGISFCSTSDTCHATLVTNPVISNERGKDQEVWEIRHWIFIIALNIHDIGSLTCDP
jgi:hypothetical protein